jgi:hypothetical protein
MGQVGDRAVLHLSRLAIGLAQQVAGVSLAVQQHIDPKSETREKWNLKGGRNIRPNNPQRPSEAL